MRRILAIALGMDISLRAGNQQKIDEAIEMYWDACKLPRKQKKIARKKAQREYSFWKNIDNWYNNQFGFLN